MDRSGFESYSSNVPAYHNSTRRLSRRFLHFFLFLATFISTTMAGTSWANLSPYDIGQWDVGLLYAILIMTIISAHEFGHYFAARYHKVDATLPYFIPFPFISFNPFGTMGAVIRTRSPIPSRKVLFDIGVAGPLAGFIVCLAILAWGFINLPDKDFIYRIHPEYLLYFGGAIPTSGLFFGDNALFELLALGLTDRTDFVPPMNEVYHYPFLCAGWFGLFITALNLLPIGQLDGGHISYAMFGSKQEKIARAAWWILVFLGICGILGWLNREGVVYLPAFLLDSLPWLFESWAGWLFWAVFTRVIIKIPHPEVDDSRPLDNKRQWVGWLAWLVLAVSFSYNGLYFITPDPEADIPGSESIITLHEENVSVWK